MTFTIDDAVSVLERTPQTLTTWLRGLPEEWIRSTEGEDSWSPYDIVGHLVHGERTDWIPRLEHVLSPEASMPFEPFDRFAQFTASEGRTLEELLDTFGALRDTNLERLRARNLTEADLARTGVHPDFGVVTLAQLLSTWVVHDLSHIAQIARVMSRRYRDDVGPWRAFIPLLDR